MTFQKYQNIKIEWITGATRSSKAVEEGISRFLAMVNEYE